MMRWMRQGVRFPRWVAVLVCVAGVMALGRIGWDAWEQQKCNENFAVNLAARSKWADQDRDAFAHLIRSVFENGGSREQIRAYTEWRDTKTLDELNALIEASFEGSADPGGVEAYQTWKRVTERNEERRARVTLPDLADCD